MKKTLILSAIFLLLLTGCINFKNNKKEISVEKNNYDEENLEAPTGILIGVENEKTTKSEVKFNWDNSDFSATISKWDEILKTYSNTISYYKNEIVSIPGKYQIILSTTKNDKKTIYTFTILENNEIDIKISDVKIIGNTYYLILDIKEEVENMNIDEIINDAIYQYYQKIKMYINNNKYYLVVTLNVEGIKVNTSNFVINESLESPGLKRL